jgi:hypothetical protein
MKAYGIGEYSISAVDGMSSQLHALAALASEKDFYEYTHRFGEWVPGLNMVSLFYTIINMYQTALVKILNKEFYSCGDWRFSHRC